MMTETSVIAEEYVRLKNWGKVKSSIQEHNLLNKIKDSTFQREFREIKKRLELLTNEQLKLLIQGGPDETKAMVLLLLLKSYSFFRDFVIEVIRIKYFLFENAITESDYIRFFGSKALSHTELNAITEQTARKVKQVMLRMLVEIGLITSSEAGVIVKPFLSDTAIAVIIRDDASWLSGFLCSDTEINTFIKLLAHG